jgi:hypothetical protein
MKIAMEITPFHVAVHLFIILLLIVHLLIVHLFIVLLFTVLLFIIFFTAIVVKHRQPPRTTSRGAISEPPDHSDSREGGGNAAG